MNKPVAMAIGLFVLAALAFPNPAKAAFVFTVEEIGSDVVVSGTGTINLSDLVQFVSGNSEAIYIIPSQGIIGGGQDGNLATAYLTVFGPASFGSGSTKVFADLAAGDFLAIDGPNHIITLNSDYDSESFLSNSATYQNQSFASLGLDLGTYVYTWGTGENADSLTVNVTTVPEPATTALLVLGGCAVLFRSRRRS